MTVFAKRCRPFVCLTLFSLIVVSIFCVSPRQCAAQNSTTVSAANVSPVERFLGRDTSVIGWVDISKADIVAVGDFLKKHKLGDDVLRNDLAQPKAVQDALVQLGVQRVYWVSDLAGLTNGPTAFIVPVKQKSMAAVKLVLDAVAGKTGAIAVTDKDVVLIGQADAVSGLQKKRTGRPDADFISIANGLKHANGLVVRTPPSLVAPIVSMSRNLANGDTGQATKLPELLKKLKTVALSSELPPPKSGLQIVTESTEAATELANVINEWNKNAIGQQADSIRLTAKAKQVVFETETIDEVNKTVESLKLLVLPLRRRAMNMSTLNSLKQIALGMHNFHDVHRYFPPQSLAAENGKRLLSWRVLILPYIGEAELYQKFHLDEPWDSAHNKTLIAKMPFQYQSHSAKGQPLANGLTRMVAPLAPQSTFGRKGPGVAIQQIIDGTSNTLLVIETNKEQAVTWTKPEDIKVDLNKPVESIIGSADGFSACLCDGSAQRFSNKIDPATLRALLSINGRETIDRSEMK